MPPRSRRLIALALLALLAAAGCAGGWRPDLRVRRADLSYRSDGVRVHVERVAPPARRGRRPAIFVLHGSGGLRGRGGAEVRWYADQLALAGYVVYIVHFFDRTRTVISTNASEDHDWPAWADALRDGVSFARTDPEVDASRIGAFGISLGGYLALCLGASDPRVGALVVRSGGFFGELAPTVQRLPPTLLLHGSADRVVPLAEAMAVDSALARLGVAHETVVYPDEGHAFGTERRDDALARTVRFFEHELRGLPPAARAP